MKVKRVIPSGYCKGVVNAINLAKKTRVDNPDENIYILGMLVHNSFVSDELSSLGIITLDDTYKSKEESLPPDKPIAILSLSSIRLNILSAFLICANSFLTDINSLYNMLQL